MKGRSVRAALVTFLEQGNREEVRGMSECHYHRKASIFGRCWSRLLS